MAKAKSRTNGEGSLYFDKSKERWVGSVTLGFTDEDKPIRRKVSAKTQKEAKQKLEELKESVRKGSYVEKDSTKLEDIILMLIEKDYALNIISDTSYKRRKCTLEIVKKSRISKLPIQNISEMDILVFFKGITSYSQSYIRKIYGQVNGAFKYGVHNNILNKNLLDNIRMPKSDKTTKKVTALTIKEQQQFLNVLRNSEHRFKYIYLLMLATGMRCGEVCALSNSDINLNFKHITIRRTVTRDKNDKPILSATTKTENGLRTIKITPYIESIIRQYMNNQYQENKQDLLFYDYRKDKILTTNQVNIAFKSIIKSNRILESDKSYSLHMLRHTFATRCIESGMPAKVLQKILGHADIETTLNTYCDVFESFETDSLNKMEQYMQNNNLQCS